jgi:nicotinamide riboside transporter PnuC
LLRRWGSWGPFITVIAYLSTLVLHGTLGAYSRFIADDYCSAGIAQRFGILRAVWYWYLNWTGRYSASALDAVFGLLGPRVTPFVPAGVLTIWLGVLTVIAIRLSAPEARQSLAGSFNLALCLLWLTLVLSPSVPQSIYWGQGMRSIVPPLILSAVYAAVLKLFSLNARRGSKYALWLVGDFLLALFMGGFNETFTALLVSCLILALAMAWFGAPATANRRTAHFLAAGALGAVVALLLVVIAPGNAFRQAFYPPPPNPLRILSISTSSFLFFLGQSIGTPERWTAMLGAVGVAAFVGFESPAAKLKSWLAPLVLTLGLAMCFLSFVPAAYGLSDAPPERTTMIPAHLLGATIVLSSFIFARHLAAQAGGATGRKRLAVGILTLASLVSVASVVLSDSRLVSSRESYAAYATHWDQVNAQILQAVAMGKDQVLIKPVDNWAGLNEPNDNPKFWVNVCYRQYYGIQVLAP